MGDTEWYRNKRSKSGGGSGNDGRKWNNIDTINHTITTSDYRPSGGSGGSGGGGGGGSGATNSAAASTAKPATAKKQTNDRGIRPEKQREYKQDISKLSDKQIDSMSRAQLSSWLLKSALAQVGDSFAAANAAEAKLRHNLLMPSNSTAQLRKSLKYARKKYRQEVKAKGTK